MTEPLSVLLEFARAEETDNPFAVRFAPQTYLLRKQSGGFDSATLTWGEELLRDIAALGKEGADPAAAARMGVRLRAFLDPTGWDPQEAAIVEAVQAGRRVHLTVRSAAAELYALPWELLTIRASGQHLGELEGVLIRYEWPETHAVPEEPSPRPQGGRILLAWSAAGGAVPAKEHLEALQRASAERQSIFDPKQDVLANVSYGRLSDALREASPGEPIAVLHVLCHGVAEGQTFGLAWNGEGAEGARVIVDAGKLRQLLAPHAGTLRLVVLSACDSGNSGALGNHLGSVAQALHRAGIQAVVASRYPLSVAGSIRFAEAFYTALLRELSSVERALLEARAALARASERQAFASLMLYAGDNDGIEIRPVVFRPYRGLLAFESRHARFFFGREAERAELKRRVEEAARGVRPRFQVIAGTSGSGKSSLVLAGLIPALIAGERAWDIVKLRPATLGGALSALWKQLHALPDKADAPAEAAAEPSTLTPRAIEVASKRVQSVRPGRTLLLVVDQFEELFTSGLAATDRDALVQALWLISRSPELSVVVLLTLRVDFLGRCGEIVVDEADARRRLDRVVYDPEHTSYIVQIDAKHLQAIIEEPARTVGIEIEDGLTDAILDDVGDDTSVLPLLEYALDELWKRRERGRLTQAAYRQMGGFKGALIRTADKIVGDMSAPEAAQARRLLVRMVSPAETGGADTRCRVEITRVRPADPGDAADFDRALDKLVRGRLLVVGDDNPLDPALGDFAEIAHEALIRAWGRLRTWVAEDREMLRQIAILKRASEEWSAHGGGAGAEEYLLGPLRLGMALEAQEKYQGEIDLEVRAFIEASRRASRAQEYAHVREQARRRRLGRAFFAVAFALLAVSLLLGRVVLRARAEAARLSIARGQMTSDPTLSAAVLREMDGMEATPGWIRVSHEVAEQPLALIALRGHEKGIFSVQWSRDGARVLTASEDGTIQIRRADDRGQPVVLKNDSPLLSALWSPEGRRVLSCSQDKTARIWDAGGVGAPLVLKHEGAVYAAVWSADGARVLTASADGAARIFRADRAFPPVVLKHSAAVYAAAWSPDGRRVLTASEDGAARIFRADDDSAPVVLKHDAAVYAAAWSPDGGRVATASLDRTARIFRADGEGAPVVLEHEDAVEGVAWSADGTRVLTRSMYGRSARVSLASGEGEPLIARHDGIVFSAAFSPDGRQIITTSADTTARVTQVDGRRTPLVLGHSTSVLAAAWSPDGSRVATASRDGAVRIWAPERVGRRTHVKHDGPAHAAAWSPDGDWIVTASDDGTARIFRADGAGLVTVLPHDEGVQLAAWSPDGSRLFTVTTDLTARVFRAGGSGPPVLLAHDAPADARPADAAAPIRAAAWSPDGSRIVTAASDGLARVFQADSGVTTARLPHDAAVLSARWSPDGRRILTTSADGVGRIFSADGTGQPLLLKPTAFVFDAQWSPDGARVAAAAGSIVGLYRADDGAALGTRQGRFGAVVAVAWSPDSARILGLSALDEKGQRRADRVSVWDANDSAALVALGESAVPILSAAWSPDGKQIVTTSPDGAARVFRPGDAEPLFILRAGAARMESAQWSADGKRIVTASADGAVDIWSVDASALMSFLWSATSSCFSPREREGLFGYSEDAARREYKACLARVGKARSDAPLP